MTISVVNPKSSPIFRERCRCKGRIEDRRTVEVAGAGRTVTDISQSTIDVDPAGRRSRDERVHALAGKRSLRFPRFLLPSRLSLSFRVASRMLVCDEGYNPFYCSVDAATFLHNLRLGLALHRHSQDHLRHSFASCLLRECSDLEFLATGAGVHVATERDLSESYLDAPKLPLIPTQADDFLMTHADRHRITVSPPSPPASSLTSSSIDARQKLRDDYSDLRGTTLWAKSSDDVNRGSFELSGKADKIKFSVPGLVYSPADPVLNRYTPQETRVDGLIARVQRLEGLFSHWLRFSD